MKLKTNTNLYIYIYVSLCQYVHSSVNADWTTQEEIWGKSMGIYHMTLQITTLSFNERE